jgi:hypothetical protein
MAFDLVAKLRLRDDFSDPLRKIQKQTERTQKIMDKLNKANMQTTKSTEQLSKAGSKLSSGFRGFGKMTDSVFSMKNAFIGLVGAIGGATAAHKIFESTIGEAAKYEQSLIMIQAMFDDEKAAKAYTEMLNKFAIDSPIMDSQTMFANSKSFITASKDVKQLEMMWSLTERLAATDPAQGLEGAVNL